MHNFIDSSDKLAFSFYALDDATQSTICDWIKMNLIKCKEPNWEYSAYSLKHCLEAATQIYIDNESFKYAMLKCGYIPVDEEENNPHYRISPDSFGLTYKCV